MSLGGTQTPGAPRQQYALSGLDLSTTPNNTSATSAEPHKRSKLSAFARRMPEGSINSFCGAVAGAASGIVTCPLDVIKTKLQAQGAFRRRNADAPQNRVPYRGMLGTARVIWTQDGLRGMYRGLGPMMVGYLPTWAVYMSVYGSSREYYYTQVGKLRACVTVALATLTGCLPYRQQMARTSLCINHCRRMLYRSHESNMGCQDSADVSGWSSSSKRRAYTMALQIYY